MTQPSQQPRLTDADFDQWYVENALLHLDPIGSREYVQQKKAWRAAEAKVRESAERGGVTIVTDKETGACVAVTRTDADGRVLSVIWEQPESVRDAEREAGRLRAEIGVLLNGAEMVARAAMPYLEEEDAREHSHDTGEVLREAKRAIAARTDETNRSAVKWMDDMQREAGRLRKLAREWLEEEEGRTLEDIVATDDRCRAATGKPGYNELFTALARAVLAASAPEGETKR